MSFRYINGDSEENVIYTQELYECYCCTEKFEDLTKLSIHMESQLEKNKEKEDFNNYLDSKKDEDIFEISSESETETDFETERTRNEKTYCEQEVHEDNSFATSEIEWNINDDFKGFLNSIKEPRSAYSLKNFLLHRKSVIVKEEQIIDCEDPKISFLDISEINPLALIQESLDKNTEKKKSIPRSYKKAEPIIHKNVVLQDYKTKSDLRTNPKECTKYVSILKKSYVNTDDSECLPKEKIEKSPKLKSITPPDIKSIFCKKIIRYKKPSPLHFEHEPENPAYKCPVSKLDVSVPSNPNDIVDLTSRSSSNDSDSDSTTKSPIKETDKLKSKSSVRIKQARKRRLISKESANTEDSDNDFEPNFKEETISHTELLSLRPEETQKNVIKFDISVHNDDIIKHLRENYISEVDSDGIQKKELDKSRNLKSVTPPYIEQTTKNSSIFELLSDDSNVEPICQERRKNRSQILILPSYHPLNEHSYETPAKLGFSLYPNTIKLKGKEEPSNYVQNEKMFSEQMDPKSNSNNNVIYPTEISHYNNKDDGEEEIDIETVEEPWKSALDSVIPFSSKIVELDDIPIRIQKFKFLYPRVSSDKDDVDKLYFSENEVIESALSFNNERERIRRTELRNLLDNLKDLLHMRSGRTPQIHVLKEGLNEVQMLKAEERRLLRKKKKILLKMKINRDLLSKHIFK